MRILFLSNFYPPYELGGYAQWCQEVALGLQARGHTIHVLTSRHRIEESAIRNEPEVTRSLYLEADINYYRPSDFFFKRPAREKFNRSQLEETVSQFEPDLIFVWGMWNLSFNLPFWAEALMPGKVAYFVSSYWPADADAHTQYWNLTTNRSWANLLKKPLKAMALSQLKKEAYPPKLKLEHAVCCSNYVRKTLIEAGKLPATAGVLYGGTNPEPFLQHNSLDNQPSTDQPLKLLYFGRLAWDKGVHTAIEALNLLKQRGQAERVRLTLLGGGHPDYEALLRRMVADFGLANQVEFAGKVPREAIPEWLGKFDIYLFTSIWPEPMARSVMEAMAAGLLVIGTEVGGQTEMLVNGENSFTFKAEDSQTLAEHITRVIDDPALRVKLAEAGQDMVLQKFTLSRMVDDIETYLTQIVSPA